MEGGAFTVETRLCRFFKKAAACCIAPAVRLWRTASAFLGRNVFFCVHAAEKMIVLYSRLRARTPAESFFFFWGCAVQMFSRRRSSFTRSRPMGRGLDAPRTRSAKLLLFQGKMS